MRRPATDINTKQRRILEFIKDSLHNEYRCPTVREICTHVGLSSTSTVQSHLNALEKFGYIKRDPNKKSRYYSTRGCKTFYFCRW